MAANREDADLSRIAIFVAAARADSFTQAASALGMTKSAVGKAIARLEQRLGLKLFHRTTRVTRLTADGEAYFAVCAAALAEIHAAEEALTSSHQIISGRLRMNMPVAFGRRVLLPLLLQIARPHPALTLSLTFTDEMVDPLQEDIDLAVRFGPLPDTVHLSARRLVSQRRIICVAPSYLATHGAPERLQDMAHHMAIVGSRRGPPMHWVVVEGGVERRLVPPTTHEMNDAEAMVDAAVAGLGLLQMPVSLVREPLQQGLLLPVLEDYAAPPVDVHALWPTSSQLSPKVRHVVDQLATLAAEGAFD
jgi:DNA-binding transcriptional LysR family regulator